MVTWKIKITFTSREDTTSVWAFSSLNALQIHWHTLAASFFFLSRTLRLIVSSSLCLVCLALCGWSVISLSSACPIISCFLVLITHWPSVTLHDKYTKTSDEPGDKMRKKKWKGAGVPLSRLKILSILTRTVVEDDRENHPSLFPDWKNSLAEWLNTHTLMHRNAMLTGKHLVARMEYPFIASPLSLCMHHRVRPNTNTLTHKHCSVCAPTCMTTQHAHRAIKLQQMPKMNYE